MRARIITTPEDLQAAKALEQKWGLAADYTFGDVPFDFDYQNDVAIVVGGYNAFIQKYGNDVFAKLGIDKVPPESPDGWVFAHSSFEDIEPIKWVAAYGYDAQDTMKAVFQAKQPIDFENTIGSSVVGQISQNGQIISTGLTWDEMLRRLSDVGGGTVYTPTGQQQVDPSLKFNLNELLSNPMVWIIGLGALFLLKK